MTKLFGDERCRAFILEFLTATEVGLRGMKGRQMAGHEDDVWERTGDDDGEETDEDVQSDG
jgi:hypothetical protein